MGRALDIGFSEALEAQIADGGINFERVDVGLGEAGVRFLQSTVLLAGQGILLGVEERVGVLFALAGGEGDVERGELLPGCGGFRRQGVAKIQTAVQIGGLRGLAVACVGFRECETEVGLVGGGRADERLEGAHGSSGVRLLQVGVGEEDGSVGKEEAAGVTGTEAFEEGDGIGGMTGSEGGLRAEEVGVVGEDVGAGGGAESGLRFGVAVVKRVGVAEGELGGGGCVAGVRGGVGVDAVVGGGSARGDKLLGHGAELRGGGEG